AAESGGNEIDIGARVLGGRHAFVVEDPLLGRAGVSSAGEVLAADAAEEGGEAEVVVLAPLLEWVVMAAGALNPQAQEQLRDVFHLLVDLVDFAVPDDGRVEALIAGGGENFTH